ncbi:MAG: rod-binding protein [Pseudomonadota bacterium]
MSDLRIEMPPAPLPKQDPALWKAAQGLESAFLSEMLKSAGLGAPRESFGGGAGEAQFGSLLRDIQVEGLVQSGGLGLAEQIYNALVTRSDG